MHNTRMSMLEIAAAAARWVVDDGMAYGPAKRQALRDLGLPPGTPLPGNDVLEQAVREHIALFCADTQPQELLALRRLALRWMERFSAFRPHLSGAVWRGTATRHSDIHLQLFCDDEKSLEILLLDKRVAYTAQTLPGFRGEPVNVLSISERSPDLGETIGIHLAVHDADDVRGALRADESGQKPRGGIEAVRKLIEEYGDESINL